MNGSFSRSDSLRPFVHLVLNALNQHWWISLRTWKVTQPLFFFFFFFFFFSPHSIQSNKSVSFCLLLSCPPALVAFHVCLCLPSQRHAVLCIFSFSFIFVLSCCDSSWIGYWKMPSPPAHMLHPDGPSKRINELCASSSPPRLRHSVRF